MADAAVAAPPAALVVAVAAVAVAAAAMAAAVAAAADAVVAAAATAVVAPAPAVLGPLLFLIYINDLHKSIKYCNVRHFAGDTNLLISKNSPKQLQKYLNLDLKNLCKWLRANKISLNASKTVLLIFKHPNKKINHEFRIKMNGKRLHPSKYVNYLGVLIDSHLNSSFHINS